MNAKQRRKERRKNIKINYLINKYDKPLENILKESNKIFSDTTKSYPDNYFKEIFIEEDPKDNSIEITNRYFYNNLKKFAKSQKELPDDIKKIMNDNMDYLYEPVKFKD